MPNPDPRQIVTDRIVFTGRVQGVGFRYTTRSLAMRHPLRGYVRNLADGGVELIVQGPAAEINVLVSELTDHFGSSIAGIDRQAHDLPESFDRFEIRF